MKAKFDKIMANFIEDSKVTKEGKENQKSGNISSNGMTFGGPEQFKNKNLKNNVKDLMRK
jgi:hypothetical protein